MSYGVLKNRLTNGTSFLRQTALDRINALADALEITQEQADELTALATAHGVDVFPENYAERLHAVEQAVAKFTAFWEAAKGSAVLGTIISLVENQMNGE